MPPPRSPSPTLDPFPPLASSRRSHPSGSSSQTYASIAAAARRRAASSSTGTQPQPQPPLLGSEDVDRNTVLDDLDYYSNHPMSNPWRLEGAEGTSTGAGESSVTGRGRALGDTEEEQEFVYRANTEPIHESNPNQDEFFPSFPGPSSSRLTQVQLPPATVPESSSDIEIVDTGIPLLNTGRDTPTGERQRLIPFPSRNRTTWPGMIPARRYTRGRAFEPMEDEEFDIVARRVMGPASTTENRESSAGGSGGPATTLYRASQRITRPLTTGRRIIEDNPGGGEGSSEIHAWNSMFDMSSDEDAWSRNTLYMQPNITGDDVPGWAGASTLRRGGNNRRRTITSVPTFARIRDPPSPENVRTGSIAPVDRSMGLTPTNLGYPYDAAIVQSTRRRPRENSTTEIAPEEKLSVDHITESLRAKKKRRIDYTVTTPLPIIRPLDRPTYLSYATIPPDTPLPNNFDPPHRTSFLKLTYQHKPNQLPRPIITFGNHPLPNNDDSDASAARANHPIPMSCGVHYYECEVLDAGIEGFMSVGWVSKDSNLGRLVGWDKGTWGWHADDGMCFAGQPKGQDIAGTWTAGDIVGCGIDFTSGRAFLTKNGKLAGHRFSNLKSGMYPAIALRSVGESICVNFTGPFLFDIDQYVREVRDSCWREAISHSVKDVVRLVDPGTGDGSRDGDVTEQAASASGASDPTEPSTSGSTPVEAEARVIAAWVLDYLQHSGMSKIANLTREQIKRRGLVNPRSSSSSASSSSTSTSVKPALSPVDVPPGSLRLNDFDSKESAIEHLRKLVSQGHPPPEILLSDLKLPQPQSTLETSNQIPQSLSRRLSIHNLVYRLSTLPEPEPEDGDDEHDGAVLASVLEYGAILQRRSKDEKWLFKEISMLHEASGLIGLASSEWSLQTKEIWAERGRENASELNVQLRRINNLKIHSYLEMSFAKCKSTMGALLEKGVAEAAFVDVRRIWEDDTKEGKKQDNRLDQDGHEKPLEGDDSPVKEEKPN